MGELIEITGKPCSMCGVAGGHAVTCHRHADRMREMTRRREEAYKTGEKQRPAHQQKRLRLGRRELDEVTDTAAKMLYGDRADAVAVLRRQMKSKDERVAQKAALEILAYTDGKPTQKIEQTNDNTTEIIYRSAAMEFEQDDEQAADVG